jgi:DNA polymerase-1
MVLYDELKLPKLELNAGGRKKAAVTHHSTSDEILTKLSKAHPLAGLIIEHRALSKVLTTYMDPFTSCAVRCLNPGHHHGSSIALIYPQWNQMQTGTGRLSCSRPNLQSLPRASERCRVRDAFVASSPDKVLVSADYSQIEMRVLAVMSKDDNLIQLFCSDADLYRMMASSCFGIALEDVHDCDRAIAKELSLGLIYGLGARALADKINERLDTGLAAAPEQEITEQKATNLAESWFRAFPKVRAFQNSVKAKARRDGFVETLAHRRRYLPDMKSADSKLRSADERRTVNTAIQGTAADLMKGSMLRLSKALALAFPNQSPAVVVLQVHDELILEVERSAMGSVVAIVRKSFEDVLPDAPIPFKVNVKVGDRLGALSPLEADAG